MPNDRIDGDGDRRFVDAKLFDLEMLNATLKAAADGAAGRERRGEPHHVAIIVRGHTMRTAGKTQSLRVGAKLLDIGELLDHPPGEFVQPRGTIHAITIPVSSRWA